MSSSSPDPAPRPAASHVSEHQECPGCGGESWKALRRHVVRAEDSACEHGLIEAGAELSFERCDSCGLVFTSPRYSEEALARYYAVPFAERADRHAAPADGATNPRYARRVRARFDRLARLVRRHSPSPRLVLDLGAGHGASLVPFLEAGARAIAIDPALSEEPHAGWDVYPSFEAVRRAGLAPDVVLSTQTFEHLLSPRETALAALATMGPGGLLVVEVPYELLWMDFVVDGRKPVVLGHGGHINFFTSDSLARTAASWGVEILEIVVGAQIKHYGGLVPSITLVARSRDHALPLDEQAPGGAPEPLQATLAHDRRLVRRAQQRERILGALSRRGRW